MFGFNKKKDAAAAPGPFDRQANELAGRLVSVGIDGAGTFDSARDVAEKALREHGSPEAAIDAVVSSHVRLVGVSGFVTNLGGFVTMPVALPANVVGFYTLATRMVAAIAYVRGRDLHDPAVRSAILLDLIASDATTVLAGAGAFTGNITRNTATNVATRRLPPAALAAVNKAVAFRIGGRLGQRALAHVPRAVPVAGGVIGAGMDVLLLRKIARTAREDFARSGA